MKIKRRQNESLVGEGPENAYAVALVKGSAITLAGVSKEGNRIRITGWEICEGKVRDFIWGCEIRNHPVNLNFSSFFDTLKDNTEQNGVGDGEKDKADKT
jgi:hypothetical protein